MFSIRAVKYNTGNLRKLKHKRRGVFGFLLSLIMSSHVCQICRRKEIWSVSGWLQIDDPVYRDKSGCSVVCNECVEQNREVFDDGYETSKSRNTRLGCRKWVEAR